MISMKEPEKSATKAEPERDGAFRLVHKRGVVQAQLPDRGLQMFEIAGVNRVDPAEHHRMNFLKPDKRLARGMALVGDGVTDLHIRG